jgi:hypothetical protein
MVEANMVIPGLDDRFGLCPGCRREGLIMPVRNGNWFACEDCRVRWRLTGCHEAVGPVRPSRSGQ